MAELIDGKHIAGELRSEIRSEVEALSVKVGRKPSLAVIIVGDDPASRIYVRNKVKAAAYVGMESVLIELSDTISEEELLAQIEKLNNDSSVDGILVQLPLPPHISKDKVIDAISLPKDVDGFHLQNSGSLWLGRRCTLPCTPRGIIHLIKSTGICIEGKNAVVVGRSNIVGKPVAKLLMDENATVTVAHSHTQNLGAITRNADILVVAVGHKGLISADMIKPGAVVIDVGMNRGEDGSLCGDVDFENARKVAGFITPVPGGVGPMTITMLLKNTIECYKAINGAQ